MNRHLLLTNTWLGQRLPSDRHLLGCTNTSLVQKHTKSMLETKSPQRKRLSRDNHLWWIKIWYGQTLVRDEHLLGTKYSLWTNIWQILLESTTYYGHGTYQRQSKSFCWTLENSVINRIQNKVKLSKNKVVKNSPNNCHIQHLGLVNVLLNITDS